jgi:hypothetical protein
VSWCHFYHNIYTGYERPDNRTIEDDEKLDNWLNSKRLERHQQEIKAKQEAGERIYENPGDMIDETFNTFDENA